MCKVRSEAKNLANLEFVLLHCAKIIIDNSDVSERARVCNYQKQKQKQKERKEQQQQRRQTEIFAESRRRAACVVCFKAIITRVSERERESAGAFAVRTCQRVSVCVL